MSDKGENYLFYWVDTDEQFNRWMFFRVDLISLQSYLNKKVTLYNLIKNQTEGLVYFVDIDADVKYHNSKLSLVEDIDTLYLPDEDSYYDFETTDSIDFASISQKYHSGILEFRITGESVNYGSISLSK